VSGAQSQDIFLLVLHWKLKRAPGSKNRNKKKYGAAEAPDWDCLHGATTEAAESSIRGGNVRSID
jgi:hypothetical protein